MAFEPGCDTVWVSRELKRLSGREADAEGDAEVAAFEGVELDMAGFRLRENTKNSSNRERNPIQDLTSCRWP
jgi:hypothetical protein